MSKAAAHCDPCDALLARALAEAPAPVLWIVDEHIAQPSQWLRERKSGVTIVSNRYDTYLDAHQAGLCTHFNDVDLNGIGTAFRSVVYRISKEKALVHHVINVSRHALQDEGSLLLVGGKQEGIKTYVEKASAYLGPITAQENGDQSTRLAVLKKDARLADAASLDDKDYARFRLIGTEAELPFYSKPGQFGWDKIDQGSQFLVAHFDSVFAHTAPGNVLDLGCGYGYLALHISRYQPTRLVATDNNAAAVASCRFNIERTLTDPGKVLEVSIVADDCGRSITDSFDTILCNPPFHQGFSTSGELTDRFIEQTRRLLKPTGQALFVVNQFIPLEQKAANRFGHVEVLDRNKSFKLVRLKKPARKASAI